MESPHYACYMFGETNNTKWLRTADSAKKLQQTQLMLVIGELSMNLNSELDLYHSVRNIWVKALTTVDKLVAGIPQSVQRADILLGISAWHLYPDMAVLSVEVKNIYQRDTLIEQGGLLTIGQLQHHGHQTNTGVHWSLPLGHLRHHRKPVITSGRINSSSGRVTFNEFTQVALGALIGQWSRRASGLMIVIDFLSALDKAGSVTTEKFPVQFGA